MQRKDAIEALRVQFKTWARYKPASFLKPLEMALKALEREDLRDKGCAHCRFDRFGSACADLGNRQMRGDAISGEDTGDAYEEVYILRTGKSEYRLVTQTSRDRVETRIRFCPCCGRHLVEVE